MEAVVTHLWINLMDVCDAYHGNEWLFRMLVNAKLGDTLLNGCWYAPRRELDQVYIVVETSSDRAKALCDVLEMIGKRKIRRNIRCRITKSAPGKVWEHIAHETRYPLVRHIRRPLINMIRTAT